VVVSSKLAVVELAATGIHCDISWINEQQLILALLLLSGFVDPVLYWWYIIPGRLCNRSDEEHLVARSASRFSPNSVRRLAQT